MVSDSPTLGDSSQNSAKILSMQSIVTNMQQILDYLDSIKYFSKVDNHIKNVSTGSQSVTDYMNGILDSLLSG